MLPQAVQGLRLCASAVGGMGLIPGQRTKIEHVIWCGQIKKKKKRKKVVSGAMSSTVDVSI